MSNSKQIAPSFRALTSTTPLRPSVKKDVANKLEWASSSATQWAIQTAKGVGISEGEYALKVQKLIQLIDDLRALG